MKNRSSSSRGDSFFRDSCGLLELVLDLLSDVHVTSIIHSNRVVTTFANPAVHFVFGLINLIETKNQTRTFANFENPQTQLKMKLTIPNVTIASLALAPAAIAGWALNPSWYGFVRPLLLSPAEMLGRQQALIDSMGFKHMSPHYQITDDDTKFAVAVDVPGVKMDDIHVSLERDNSILSISGGREVSGESYNFTSKFSQSFSLDPSVDVSSFTANLKDGVLVVSAAKDLKRLEQSVKKIPISENNVDDSTPTIEQSKEKVSEPVTESQEKKVPIEMK